MGYVVVIRKEEFDRQPYIDFGTGWHSLVCFRENRLDAEQIANQFVQDSGGMDFYAQELIDTPGNIIRDGKYISD